MAGPTSLKSVKALLTRYCNNLERIVKENEAVIKADPETFCDSAKSAKAQAVTLQLNSSVNLVIEALNAFTTMCDSLGDTLTAEQQEQVDDYVTKAHNVLELAQTAAIQLECNRTSARDHAQTPPIFNTQFPSVREVGVAQKTLPPIPIPSFSGKVWEFQNFWTLFAANVHNQPLTKLQKFNYLLRALQGEAREAVRRYPITEGNYDHAIDLLRKKYGDDTKFIACLQSRLESARADKPSIPSQRRLLEILIPIVTQLEEKGVSFDGSFLVQKILSKFSVDLQRKVLQRRMDPSLGESAWVMQNALADLDEIISMEERISEMVHSKPDGNAPPFFRENKRPKLTSRGSGHCIFCGSGDHKSMFCKKCITLEERRTVFREHNRCLNCAITGHFINECPKDGCKACNGKKHHHTLCPQRCQIARGAPVQPPQEQRAHASVRPASPTAQQNPRKNARQAPQKKAKPAQSHLIEIASCEDKTAAFCEEANDPRMVLSTMEKDTLSGNGNKETSITGNNVFLLTGVARVGDSVRNLCKDVEVLLDTGADQSFISQGLADELGLVCKAQKSFIMYTFGTETPRQTTCGVTMLDLWDHEGVKHELRLYTTPVLTAKGKSAQLDVADLEYIARHKIPLSRNECERSSKPQILLGCDQLWNLLDVPYPRHTLPSGLQLVPSKLGYLVTGRQVNPPGEEKQVDWTGKDVPTFVNSFANFDEELERWDKYWTMDSAGVCEFTGTKNAERDATNAKVAKFFEETIEKRDDGYYIRFPYKENHPPLPTNKAIALKRLRSVLETLRKTPQLLRDYNETFRAQQEIGVIEEIKNPSRADGVVVHYIPHQPVITPHKETTKLRIVFDASAHFKDSPSLNDVLHQGPLILPELYAMLLRFRVPKYVITSDVEKAFLQVRLHETDRDATRFLWVRDVTAPFDERNVVTFRFTRVTFGLNVSPYLLGATIIYHLQNAVENEDLANEIRENLYVDNLILSAATPAEATEKSLEARKIFEEMGMNLREFLSNDERLRQNLPENVYAKASVQKVLGIPWNSETDCLEVRCSLTPTDPISKRTVARQIASIYDPLGWLVPLLMPAKKFQQDLWRQKFDWDTELPPEVASQWMELSGNISGFRKSIPRRCWTDLAEQNLAVFADASEVAIAACTYLFSESASSLMMAKSKLPSIKTKTTMPKLEMNALTLATRLVFSVAQALKMRDLGHPTVVYIFSDSQIVLSWLSSTRRNNLGVLVENRLREVRRIVRQLQDEAVSVVFGYVSTSENPADAGTRGLTKEQITDHNWWNGPSFLRTPVQTWTTPFYSLTMSDAPAFAEFGSEESANINVTRGNIVEFEDLLEWSRYSSLPTAKRVTAFVLRFIKKLLRNKAEAFRTRVLEHIPELKQIQNSTGPLQGCEVRAAKLALIRNHQLIYVTKEYRKSMENTLRLYQDKNNIWRSKGRLGLSALSDDAKSPIFIAPNTALAQKIIHDAHGPYHRGVDHTIATVREQFWIPKLRQQVRTTTKQCIQCRRFNALPYRYPDTADLPYRRVSRCRPFQHIGLDFFDLPSCREKGENYKLYGCIFTCTVTRLLHLEVVRSMATNEFINALRRFIARRGLPESITCDNAPTFLLSANILGNQCDQLNVDILRSVTNKEIQWNHITPYAPWQGGFYERLIKSIKHSIHKALRGAKERSFDDIQTFVAEVEACLNSRPLTYQASAQEELSSVRPIDFLQRDIAMTLKIPERIDNDASDYLPPDELRAIQYREQVVEALHSSCEATELFWKVWQTQYLTSLRETHKRVISNHRIGREIPTVGDVVLVNEPILPRNSWKMARIVEVRRGMDGEIREAELQTGTRRKIRRPVNLLIPLEIQESRKISHSPRAEEVEEEPGTENTVTPQEREPRYNLRPRKPVRQVHKVTLSSKRPTSLSPKWFLFYLMLLALVRFINASEMSLSCTKNGVLIHADKARELQVCAENICKIQQGVEGEQLVRFPPEVTLHDHNVILKWHTDEKLATISTVCQGIDFCSNIDCWVCPSILFNPECWPMGAILTIALLLYSFVAVVYLLLYVPMTIGKPIRIMLSGLRLVFHLVLRLLGHCVISVLRKFRRKPTVNARIAAALAVLLALLSGANACQQVDILEHHSTLCHDVNGRERCTIALTEVMKINSYKQQACLHLVRNSTLVANVKLRWRGLYLRCEQESLYFTRSVNLNVISSKRCSSWGSCKGLKCAGVKATSLIKELNEGNKYPGRTGCLESCGGIGCMCLTPSSGCLFYRVYATPRNAKVYEVFRCMRWSEHVKLEVVIENMDTSLGNQHFVIYSIPNVPVIIPPLQLTLTSLSVPPTPALAREFISDGIDTSIWSGTINPPFRCETWEEAQTFNCTVRDDCRCTAAEFTVVCNCPANDIEKEFRQLALKIPVKTAFWELTRSGNSTLFAKLPRTVSSEFIVNFNQTIDTALQVTRDDVCTIDDASLQGCYHCSRGARATVRCFSTTEITGEVLCGHQAFAIPCAVNGPESVLNFHFESARQLLQCTITCGTKSNNFVLSGILNYVNALHPALLSTVEGRNNIYQELQWPDFGHIFSIIFTWYKTLLIALLAVALALLVSYICISSIGLRLLLFAMRIVWALSCFPLRMLFVLVRTLKDRYAHRQANGKKSA